MKEGTLLYIKKIKVDQKKKSFNANEANLINCLVPFQILFLVKQDDFVRALED